MKSQGIVPEDLQKNRRLIGSTSLPTHLPRTVVIDILLLGALSATVVTAFIDASLHIPVGTVLTLILGTHLSLHRKYWASILKGLWHGRSMMRSKWLLNTALLLTFVSTVLSGIIVASIFAPNISSFHRSVSIVFSVLTITHLYTRRKWIVYQFKKTRKSV